MSIQNINALDRVPTEVLENGAVRYEEFDADGNSLGYKYIKRADNPVEAGTNINKVLFDLIDSNTNEEQGERSRVDRYNVPTLGQSSNYESVIGDIIPKAWTEVVVGSEYSNENIKLTASSYRGNISYSASKACDGDEATFWMSISNSLEKYLMIDFETAKKISKMKIKGDFYYTAYNIKIAKIQGSNDAEIWSDLYTINNNLNSLTELTLDNPDFYRYYRIYQGIPYNSTDNMTIEEWQVSEHYQPSNLLNLDLDIEEYFINQRVLIHVPNNLDTAKNTYININNLGEKSLNGNLSINSKYELIYNGESFDAILRDDTINNNLSIKTGTISDGAVIPQTSGYSNYIYMVSINSGETSQYASSGARYVGIGINCSVNQDTRVVTAQVGVLASYSSSNIVYASATANYTEIAWN